MSFIKLPLLYLGSKGKKNLNTLFDSSVNLSCIHPNYLKELETPIRLGRVWKFYKADPDDYIEIKEAILLDFYINDILLSDEFLIVPDINEEIIIGAATLRKWRIKLDVEHDQVVVDPSLAKLRFSLSLSLS
jgi:hypothetical protein